RKQEPTAEISLLPPPQEVLDDPDFKKTSKRMVKQLINVRLVLDVKEYHADVYYNSKTGERRHAKFPDGVVDDVNYGGSVKAFLFLLNNDCCISIDKSRKFLADLTSGKLRISKGMISRLSKEFAQKSEKERKKLFADMLLSPVMHTDCTNARVNGKAAYVFVCATPYGESLYFARGKKGHEGVKGTVAEDYQGILIHDHETTFYRYGTNHQECLAHILRYLKDSADNEPERTWNTKMRKLVQEMIHYRNSIQPEAEPDIEKVSKLEERYQKILQKAAAEYESIPPSEYYKDGYNLYLRMQKYMSNHLLFLHDHRVPTTNNEAERLLRGYKRKQQQAVSFRSLESIDYLCQCMSMLVSMRKNDEMNIFEKVAQTFG
ncbi:MAG: IS66 family transposase, partial [Enterobacterales bacterium]